MEEIVAKSEPYVPTTGEVRYGWWMDVVHNPADNVGESDLAFDRWLEAHDRSVAAKALRDASLFRREHDFDHDYWTDLAERKYTAGDNLTSVWLDEMADRIEQNGEGQ